jgi:hypothetical protein
MAAATRSASPARPGLRRSKRNGIAATPTTAQNGTPTAAAVTPTSNDHVRRNTIQLQ